MLTEKKSYLSFQLENEIFAVNVINVLEVLQMQKITRVPKTPDYIQGVINFRGDILPVIDTRKKFNLTAVKDMTKFVVIILNFQRGDSEQKIGAIVDSVLDVTDFKEIDIKDVPEMGSRYNLEFIYGMIKFKDDFIMILDVDKVFSTDELTIVKDVADINKTTEKEKKKTDKK